MALTLKQEQLAALLTDPDSSADEIRATKEAVRTELFEIAEVHRRAGHIAEYQNCLAAAERVRFARKPGDAHLGELTYDLPGKVHRAEPIAADLPCDYRAARAKVRARVNELLGADARNIRWSRNDNAAHVIDSDDLSI